MAKTLTEMAVELATAQASHSTMSAEELEIFLTKTFQTLNTLKNLEEGETVGMEESPEPALDPKKSILKNKVICLECGREFKILTSKHLQKEHGMDSKEYRKKYGFSARQSLAAKSLSAERSATAKKHKLGEKLQANKKKRVKKASK
ncbi:MAG: MucR family transcriptional regulator [Deltaproteobacteria bacterium]|nr:MucR family transcriptional regulator [Deltaproteobacteria bacterium]